MASVELRHVSKRFDNGTEAVKDFSLTIGDGELVVLVGSSGCGKSTLLRMLAGLESVSEGEILIDGKVVNQATPQQRNTAMVFQNYALYPHMTVRANLEFPLEMSRTPRHKIAAKVGEIADMLHLTSLMDRKPRQLSGGQRQRVAMGRALVRNPSLFLLDEPLSNLDAKLRAQIRAEIAQTQKRLRTTTLYVTHDQVEAMTLGDRVVVLEQGAAQQIGTPRELYHHPQNIFVARFLGSPGMNLMPTVLADKGNAQLGFNLGTQQIKITASQAAYDRLAQYAGQDVHIGIRPEAFGSVQTAGNVRLESRVEAVEFLGHETLVYLSLPEPGQVQPGQPLVARLPGRFEKPCDDQAVFFIEADALYFFDRAGRNIMA